MSADDGKSQSHTGKVLNYLTSEDSFNIFKAVPAAFGIGGVALAVFYYLLSQVLSLGIFEKLTATHTFLIILILLIVVTIVVTFAMWLWYKDAKNKITSTQFKKKTGANFDVPDNAIFSTSVDGIAKRLDLVVTFEGFTDEQLNSKLKSRNIKTTSWIEGLKLLGQLSEQNEFPNYSVLQGDGTLIIKVVESCDDKLPM